jgi:hypothetical protein
MSEHTWTLENLASYTAGGLEAAERERLEQHTATCATCSQALQEARAMDQTLETLFAGIRPEPSLEDRMIHALRLASVAHPWSIPFGVRLALGAAAVLLLGVLGAFVSSHMDQGGLVFPGSGQVVALFDGDLRTVGFATYARTQGALVNSREQLEDREPALGDDSHSIKARIDVGADKLAQEIRQKVSELGTPSADNHLWALSSGWGEGRGAGSAARSSGSSSIQTLSEKDVKAMDKSPASGGERPGQRGGTSPSPAPPPPSEKTTPARGGFPGGGGFGGGGGGFSSFRNNQPLSSSLTLNPNGRSSATAGSPAPPASSTLGRDLVRAPRPPVQAEALPDLGAIVITGNTPADVDEVKKIIEKTKQSVSSTTPQQPPNTPKGANESNKADDQKPNAPAEPAVARKIVIRSGELEFEIDSFDTAVATVRKFVDATAGSFIATINSEKLPNGKVRGSVTLRVPPERLDGLVENLRRELGKAGELRSQRLGSLDISKQYTDLESRLRAARTLEERLLQIIKAGKGEIKDLLQAEKELGVWRTKIEEFEGELRYYNNLVALSTLTLTLYEKEIRTPSAITETERVQMGIEVEDVDQAQQAVLAAVAEAKGRVLKSELKQQAAGQFHAVLQFEVAPEAAGPLRDRLRQLGQVSRLEIDRLQQAEDGNNRLLDGKTKRVATQFSLSLYNLANIQPRETATLQVATKDVPAGYRSLQEAIGKTQGRVFNAQLSEQDKQNITADLDFEIRRTQEATLDGTLARIGEVYSRNVVRAPESENVSDRKVRFQVKLVNQVTLPPRETVVLGLEVVNVDTTAAFLSAMVRESQGRIVESQVAHERNGRVTARQVFDVPLAQAAELVDKFKGTGTLRVQQASRNPQAPEGALAAARLEVTLSNVDLIVPSDEGLWPQIRRGLYTSFVALSWSVTVVVVGVCFVLPWAVVCYGIYRLVLRLRRRPGSASTPA